MILARNKPQVMSFKECVEIVRPKYVFLKIIPDTSIRNYNSENIAKTMAQLYKSVYRRAYIDSKKFFYETPAKVSFMMDITKENVNFYFVCPIQYSKLIKEKCHETWSKITIKEVEDIPPLTPSAIKYQVRYQKEDALSIKVDKRTNQPLNNIMNVIDIMEEDDRVTVIYNFIPCTQKPWLKKYESTIEKYANGVPVDKEHGKIYFAKIVILGALKIVNEILEMASQVISSITGSKDDSKKWQDTLLLSLQSSLVNNHYKLNQDTNLKKDAHIIDTQIVIVSDSKDKTRKVNNAVAVCESYRALDGDNRLIYEKLKDGSTIYYTDFKLKNAMVNTMSTTECKNLLELPGRELLLSHQNIEKVDVLENPVPEELQQGFVCLGEVTYRGKQYKAFLPSNYDKASLPLVLLSAQGGGKTTLICNMVINAIMNNESCIVIDYIKNCELSNAIKAVTPSDKIIEIDCSNINKLQGFGYNEITMAGNTEIEKLDMANLQAQQTLAFINAINVDDESRGLTSQMKRYLRAAANVVYFAGKQNIGDVIKCLEDYKIRKEYVDIVNKSDEAKKILRRELTTLDELDERDKNGNIVGTKSSIALKGILDRIDDLQQDMRTKIMFNKDCSDNINFVDCMNKGKVILIKMPENIFFSVSIKDMLTTFFCTKYILAIKLRSSQGRPRRCNMIIDEPTQCEGAQACIKETLTQTRKFGGKYIFAMHYMSQLKYKLDAELKGAGASFILLQGSDRMNYEEFKDELQPYQLEDLLRLKQFHAINLLKTNQGWTKFITKLPPEPIELKKLRDSNNI